MADTWANSGLDLHLELTGRRGLRASIERALRDAVADGRLAAGVVVPPSRTLAADLGVARNTVAEAYAQLVAEGWLEARSGSGTRVAHRPTHDAAPGAVAAVRPRERRYDLRAGFPDLSSFPRAEWTATSRTALATAPARLLGYGWPAGLPDLRVALAAYLGRARGVHATPERTVVTAGFTNALGTLAGVLVRQGARRVGVEAFGHARHRRALHDAGLRTVSLPVDADGAVVEGLERLDAVLLTSAHQFPLGAALSARRRASVTRWAARTGALVIEDDYDGEFRYDRRALGAVQALAPDHVIYAGTASKTLTPGLCLGWLVLPERWVEPVVAVQDATRAGAAALEQLTLAEYLASGRYDRHVRRMRLYYRRRRDRLLQALTRRGLTASGTSAGLHATVLLPTGLPAAEVVTAAATRDLDLAAIDQFAAVPGAGPNGLVVGYGTPPPHLYSAAVARLLASLPA